MKFTKDITIQAPAEKVWEVYGKDFANIGTWSTAVPHSRANHDLEKVNGSPVGGRVCSTVFGDLDEKFTDYSDQEMKFSFYADFKSPMLKKAINNSKVIPVDNNSSKLEITSEIEPKFLGKLMAPIMKKQLNSALDEILQDLKYYVEHGKPSPAKQASIKKAGQ